MTLNSEQRRYQGTDGILVTRTRLASASKASAAAFACSFDIMFDSHVSGSHAILGLFDTVHFRPTDRPTDRSICTHHPMRTTPSAAQTNYVARHCGYADFWRQESGTAGSGSSVIVDACGPRSRFRPCLRRQLHWPFGASRARGFGRRGHQVQPCPWAAAGVPTSIQMGAARRPAPIHCPFSVRL